MKGAIAPFIFCIRSELVNDCGFRIADFGFGVLDSLKGREEFNSCQFVEFVASKPITNSTIFSETIIRMSSAPREKKSRG